MRTLGVLNRFYAVDVQERNMHGVILFRVANDEPGFQDHYVFRVADLMRLAVRQLQHERFKRLALHPFQNGLCVHGFVWLAGGGK